MMEALTPPTAEEGRQMLSVARASIEHGLKTGQPLSVLPEDYPAPLRIFRGAFVTLHHHGELRGCVGTIEGSEPLVSNIAHYAYAAAFADSRFPPLTTGEFKETEIHISILSGLAEMRYGSEAELLEQIQPGIDGLLLEEGSLRGTLLPSVWEEIPDKSDFLCRLKRKAGLPEDYWSASVRVRRYHAVCVPG